MTNKITKTTWRLLRERLDIVLRDETPKRVEKREFYYICRKAFQDEWDLIEVDIKGADDGTKNPYVSWGDLINKWALKQCNVMGVEQGRFWKVMAKLNIWPHEKGTCLRETSYGARRETVVRHSTKEDIMENCSFIIVSEKQSKAEELYNALRNKGYVVNLISMGGHSTGTVQSIAAEVGDLLQLLDAQNFYILVLHDYDIDGITMVYTLRKWYDNVLDVGINRELLVHSGIDKDKKLYEAVKIKKYPTKLIEWVKNQPEYSVEELIGLLGSSDEKIEEWFEENRRRESDPKLKNIKWTSTGKRIELDTIYGVYGIEPMVKYIDHVLQTDTEVWDLRRIGIEEEELEEGDNLFEETRDDLYEMVGRAYGEKAVELAAIAVKIREIVAANLKQPTEFGELKTKYITETGETAFLRYTDDTKDKEDKRYWSYNEVTVDEVQELYEKYPTDKDYVTEYQEKVDDEVNNMLDCWEGDITTVKNDIDCIVSNYQHDLDEEKEDDPELIEFKQKLEKIDWGEEELKDIKEDDPVEKVDRVIKALKKYKMELQYPPRFGEAE